MSGYTKIEDIPFYKGKYWIHIKPSLSPTGKTQNKRFDYPTEALKHYRKLKLRLKKKETESYEEMIKKLNKTSLTFDDLLELAVSTHDSSLTLEEYHSKAVPDIIKRCRNTHSQATIRVGKAFIKTVKPNTLLANLTEKDAEAFLGNKKWNPKSKNTKLIELKSYFKTADKEKYWSVNEGNPFKKITPWTYDKEIEYASLDCVEDLFLYLLTKVDVSNSMRVCLPLHFFVGMGEDEIKRGKFSDIYIPQVGQPTITIHGLKTSYRRRKVKIPYNVMEMLEPFIDKIKQGSDEPFFPESPLNKKRRRHTEWSKQME